MLACGASVGAASLWAGRGQALPMRPCHGQAAPCGLAAGSGRCFCSQAAFLLAPRPQSDTRLWAAALAGGHPLVGGPWLQPAWPWVAGLHGGLAMASRPFSSLPSL
ncbi:hypothetical protein OPV22_010107 [Ensete ventricosum]|uniref:Secreted protein n=1 Tax=Ensete ventricosum TaxID=4639 RepID=A0AAV8PTF2_ENSVE|nr:hypothetical protein OPV22_010107 [Ensete ventricosum]